MFAFPQPGLVACAKCGAHYWRWEAAAHECEEERLIEFVIANLRPLIAAFEFDFAAWCETKHGRFELFYAETRRP